MHRLQCVSQLDIVLNCPHLTVKCLSAEAEDTFELTLLLLQNSELRRNQAFRISSRRLHYNRVSGSVTTQLRNQHTKSDLFLLVKLN